MLPIRHVALLVVAAAACSPRYPRLDAPVVTTPSRDNAPSSVLPAQNLQLLVWNVHKGTRRGFSEALDQFVAEVDLAILQEVYVDRRRTQALASGKLRWVIARSFVYAARPGRPATGVAIGSTAAATTKAWHVTANTEPILRTPKASLLVSYPMEGTDQQLLVVNVHGINFHRAAYLQAQLAALGQTIAAHHGPVVVAGDFNTHHRPRTAVVRRLAATLGLRAAFAEPDESRRPPPPDGRTRFRGWPLDHVFVRGLVVQRAWVSPTTRASDHQALRVTVSLTTAP